MRNLTPRPVKYRPLRFTLTVTITALIIAASVSILAISYFGSATSMLALSESMTGEISKGIIEKITHVMRSAEKAGAVVSLMVEEEFLDPNEGVHTMNVAAALVAQNEGISSIELGLANGSKYKAAREADGTVTRFTDIRSATNVTRTYYYDKPDAPNRLPNTVQSLEEGYDARKRPWFQQAVSAGKPLWGSDMYVSGTMKQFEYSYVTPIYAKDGSLTTVVSANIKLMALSEFLGKLKILQHGKPFIVNDRDQVIAVPIKSDSDLDQIFKPAHSGSTDPYELYAAEGFPDRDIRTAVATFRRNGTRSFEFTGASGAPILASVVQFPYQGSSDFTIGIILPKSDIMGTIARNTTYMFMGVLVFLLLAILIGFAVARRISHSLTVLSDEVDKVARLQLDSDTVVQSHILEVATIDEAVRNMKRGLRSFRKYVPVDVVLQLNAQKKEAILEGERRELTIFFSDIADFTSISEQLPIEELVPLLGIYFSGMTRIVLDHSGTLDKYIGDAIMAFWGAPQPRENHARLACASALACQEYLDDLAAAFIAKSHPVFHTRIGIHTGEAIVGNIGSEDRINYTIIGDSVNLASRLEGLNKVYKTKILISDDTYRQVRDEFVARRLDSVAVKGKTHGVLIHELVCAKADLKPDGAAFLEAYERAIELYQNRSWEQAKEAFSAVHPLAPGGKDYPSELLSERCEEFLRNPPAPDWNGVYAYHSK